MAHWAEIPELLASVHEASAHPVLVLAHEASMHPVLVSVHEVPVRPVLPAAHSALEVEPRALWATHPAQQGALLATPSVLAWERLPAWQTSAMEFPISLLLPHVRVLHAYVLRAAVLPSP